MLGEQLLIAFHNARGRRLFPLDGVVQAGRFGFCAYDLFARGFVGDLAVRKLRRQRRDPLVSRTTIIEQGRNLFVLARETFVRNLE